MMHIGKTTLVPVSVGSGSLALEDLSMHIDTVERELKHVTGVG